VKPVTVILDTNLWSYIGDEEARPALDELLRANGFALCLAPSVLLEALRTPKPDVRRKIVTAMVSGRPARRLQSEAESEAQEVVAEIRRARPGWMRRLPDLRRADSFHRWWRKGIWAAVESDLDGFLAQSALLPLQDWDERIVLGQKEMRQAIIASNEDWSALDGWVLPAEDSPDWYLEGWPTGKRVEGWRASNRDVFWDALALAPKRHLVRYEDTTYADFVGARVDLLLMTRSRAEFTRFWFEAVDRQAVRRCWIRWAVAYAQTLTKVTGGNPRDAQHAAYLCDCDIFMTADVRYAQTLNLVRRAAGFSMARVVLVRRSPDQSAVEAIGHLLASPAELSLARQGARCHPYESGGPARSSTGV